MKVKFAHTSICARNWESLARFYMRVFDCQPIPPERFLSGPWIEKLTGIKGAEIRGVHLKLPGYEDGPTLEIFEYDPSEPGVTHPKPNSPGLRHIAFHADDVQSLLKKALSNGAEPVGKRVITEISDAGMIEVIYIRDIEGNIIEIQNWRE